MHQEKNNLALRYFDKSLEISPENEWALGSKGLALTLLGRNSEAIQYYDLALEINPNNVNALVSKGFAFAEQGKPTQALPYFERALELDKRNSFALTKKGFTLIDMGNYTESLSAFNATLDYYPQNKYALNGKGWTLFKLGYDNEAIQFLRMSVEVDKNYGEPRINIGRIFTEQGKYDEALIEFDTALNSNLEYTDAFVYKADALHLKGVEQNSETLIDDAKNHYDIALDLEPENVFFINKKASFLAEEGKEIQSLFLYDRALTIDENNFDSLIGKAELLSQKNDCTSIDFYERAIESNPGNKKIKIDKTNEESKCSDILGVLTHHTAIIEGALALIISVGTVFGFLYGRYRTRNKH